MIELCSADGGVQFAVWSHDTRAVSFERVFQVYREKVLALDLRTRQPFSLSSLLFMARRRV